MNSKYIDFFGDDFAVFHYNEPYLNVYQRYKEQIDQNAKYVQSNSETKPGGFTNKLSRRKSSDPLDINSFNGIGLYGPFWNIIKKPPVFHFNKYDDGEKNKGDLLLKQVSEDGRESIAIYGKALDKIELHTSNGIILHDFVLSYFKNLSVAWFDIDFSQNIEKIVIQFRHNILDSFSMPVTMITKEQIELEQAEEQKKLDAIVPEIKHKFSIGESLINIKFEHVYNHLPIKVVVELYDEDKFLMGTYKPEAGMNFLTINNLAYGKYFYIIRQFDIQGKELQKTDYVEWNLVRPNHGKPIR